MTHRRALRLRPGGGHRTRPGGTRTAPRPAGPACARTLAVDDAGLSLVDASQQRIPLGASSDVAEAAERLQFTVGAGPCMTAQETRQPVFAVEEDLRRRWPVFTELLFGATPFCAIVALPLQPALAGAGAIDLYFRSSAEVLALDVFEAIAVGELVTSALSDAAVWSVWAPSDGPQWLHGTGSAAPGRRLGGDGQAQRRPRGERAGRAGPRSGPMPTAGC